MIPIVKENIVFALKLTVKQASKNAANVINGMLKVMIGQVLKTLDKSLGIFVGN